TATATGTPTSRSTSTAWSRPSDDFVTGAGHPRQWVPLPPPAPDSMQMTTFRDSREHSSPSFTHPVSEALSRYLAMTAPGRARAGTGDRTPPASVPFGSDGSAQLRAEELWDALGDFA